MYAPPEPILSTKEFRSRGLRHRSAKPLRRALAMRDGLALMTILGIVSGWSQFAAACSCTPSDARAAATRSDYVFDGTVVEASSGRDREGQVAWIMRVRVDRAIKGAPPREVTIYSHGVSTACGVHYDPGYRTRFAVAGALDELRTSLCLMFSINRKDRDHP